MNDSVLKYEGRKFDKGSVAKVTDPLTVEQALQISINGEPFTVVMQTPGNEMDLTYGLLYAEDVLPQNNEMELIEKPNKQGFIEEVDITIDPAIIGEGIKSSRSLLSVSSCGICGKVSMDDVQVSGEALESEVTFDAEDLFKMQEQMFANQTIFSQTGGCHGVAAFDKEGQMLTLREDVGRHNALDKVVGDLLFRNFLSEAKVISFSGRISYEIVSKCFRAKIPIIIAVSAPSSLAVDFAKEYGMTILSFTRDSKTTCYANPWRILELRNV